jgi:hypothetical protein
MESDQHCLAHFSGIGLSYWSTNGHSRRFGEMRRGPLVLATQRARCQSGAKLLSFPNLSGWPAEPNGRNSPWARLLQLSESVSAVDTFCVSPLCTADD